MSEAEEFPQWLPAVEWLPVVCRKAAMKMPHLVLTYPSYRQEAQRILSNDEFKAFWVKVADIAKKTRVPSYQFVREFIVILITRGGIIPSETLAEKAKRRKHLASLLKRLDAALSQEKELANLTLTQLLGFADPDAPALTILHQCREPKLDHRMRNPFVGKTAWHALEEDDLPIRPVLKDVATKLERFEPLSEWDVTYTSAAQYPSRTPQKRKGHPQHQGVQTMLERTLYQYHQRNLDQPHYALIAEAEYVSLGIETTGDEVGGRLRNWKERDEGIDSIQLRI